MELKIIDRADKADINVPNEPFAIYGRMIPSLSNGVWSFTTELFPKDRIETMTFPDEDYDFDEMSKDCVFVGAYENGACVGLAVWRKEWHKYLYLHDLKVAAAYRGAGVGRALVENGKELARSLGYRGVYTVGQDDNLAACAFYIKCGFSVGGFNNRVYDGTSQHGKGDIYFYFDV